MSDKSWMLQEMVTLPGVYRVMLFTSDGIREASAGDPSAQTDKYTTDSAGLGALASLSTGIAGFLGTSSPPRQQLIEFDDGAILIIAAEARSYLAVAARHDVDWTVVRPALEKHLVRLRGELTIPVRQDGAP